MGHLLPVIKNFAWFKDDAMVLKEQFMDFDQSPVIGIGEDMDEVIKFMEATAPESYATEMETKKTEALLNLKNLDIAYEVQDVNGNKVIVVNREEYSCEKILDEEYLNKLHTELASPQIAIGIPFQGLFIAISNESADLLQKFPAVIKKHYDNPQADRISDRMFLSVNGKVVAYSGIETDAAEMPGEAKEEACFVQTMTLTGATEKDMEFIVFIGHRELAVLKANFEKTFIELVNKCKEEEAISCTIKYMIIPEIIQKTEGLVAVCNELSASFCNADLITKSAPALHHFKVVFNYAEAEIIAEAEVKMGNGE